MKKEQSTIIKPGTKEYREAVERVYQSTGNLPAHVLDLISAGAVGILGTTSGQKPQREEGRNNDR